MIRIKVKEINQQGFKRCVPTLKYSSIKNKPSVKSAMLMKKSMHA